HIGRAIVDVVVMGEYRADQKIPEAIAIDITGTADRKPSTIVVALTADPKSVGAVEIRKVQIAAETSGFPKHQVSRTGLETIGIGKRRTDEQVGKAVAIDVA